MGLVTSVSGDNLVPSRETIHKTIDCSLAVAGEGYAAKLNI